LGPEITDNDMKRKDYNEFEYEVNRLERQGKISEETGRSIKSRFDINDDFDIERKLRNEGVSYFDIDRVLGR
jgi:hypothetical protein